MSTSAELLKSPDLRELPLAIPLDEAVWQAWVLKGRAQDERIRSGWRKVMKCTTFVVLLFVAAADAWPILMPYEVIARCLLTAGTAVLMFQEFSARRYILGLMFGALVLLYNPVAPVFRFSGEWQRGLELLSLVPFAASLTSRGAKLVPNEQN